MPPVPDNQLHYPLIKEDLDMLSIENEKEIYNGDTCFDVDDEADFEDEEEDLSPEEMEDVSCDVSTS